MIWSKCPKRIHVAKADSVCEWNEMRGHMLILQAMDQFPKYKQDVCKTITFVSNVDVQAFITYFHNKWYFNEILFVIV